jgi:hypothetical protein
MGMEINPPPPGDRNSIEGDAAGDSAISPDTVESVDELGEGPGTVGPRDSELPMLRRVGSGE